MNSIPFLTDIDPHSCIKVPEIRSESRRSAEQAKRKAIELLAPPPKVLAQLFDIGVDGLAAAREQWNTWHAGVNAKDLGELADHLERHHEAFADAIDDLKQAVARELKRREDRWRPIATAVANWIELARKAREKAEDNPMRSHRELEPLSLPDESAHRIHEPQLVHSVTA